MTTFTAPGPLQAFVEVGTGQLTVETGAPDEATATVEALDPANSRAVEVAAQAEVRLDGTRLLVKTRSRRASVPLHVRLVLPPLSDLDAQSGDLSVEATGELGTVRIRLGTGRVQVPEARGAVDVKAGDVTVDLGTAGSVSVTAGRGDLHVGSAGDVSFKTGHGSAELLRTAGKVAVRGGTVSLDLREASAGEVVFVSGAGSARVGVAEGTTVQLDLMSGLGDVRCDLPMEQARPDGGAALRLRLKTGTGDVLVGPAA